MTDYISRDDAIKIIDKYLRETIYVEGGLDGVAEFQHMYTETNNNQTWLAEGLSEAAELLEDVPSADVAPVKRGKWIPHIEEDYIGEGQYGYIELLKCSECGTLVPNKRNFCHHCGAKMGVDG